MGEWSLSLIHCLFSTCYVYKVIMAPFRMFSARPSQNLSLLAKAIAGGTACVIYLIRFILPRGVYAALCQSYWSIFRHFSTIAVACLSAVLLLSPMSFVN